MKLSGSKSKDNHFYFFCVFLTKVTIIFLRDTFINLDIDVFL